MIRDQGNANTGRYLQLMAFKEHWLGQYLAITGRPLDSAVQLRTADRIEGPWSAPTELPASATLLVTADLCPVQMFRVKDNLYGTQFHPELDEAGILQRIRVYRDAGYFDPAEQDRVEAQVRGVDARPAGLVIRNFVARYAR